MKVFLISHVNIFLSSKYNIYILLEMQSWLLPKVFMRKLRMEWKGKVSVIAVKLPKKKKSKIIGIWKRLLRATYLLSKSVKYTCERFHFW